MLTLFFLSTAVSALKFSPDHQKVTLGSIIKLTHSVSGFKLHSHEIAYGSGSGQQSITAFPESSDSNSLFYVEAANGEIYKRGNSVTCNSKIRLRHLNTGKYVHSHKPHQAPLSGHQEVSGYDGGNSDDDWIVKCEVSGDWRRDKPVEFIHASTNQYLFASKAFTYRNPISGQLEVSATESSNKECIWKAQEGIYFSDNPMF